MYISVTFVRNTTKGTKQNVLEMQLLLSVGRRSYNDSGAFYLLQFLILGITKITIVKNVGKMSYQIKEKSLWPDLKFFNETGFLPSSWTICLGRSFKILPL